MVKAFIEGHKEALNFKQTGRETASGEFLGSFVLPAAKELVEKLQDEQPGALECASIWQSG